MRNRPVASPVAKQDASAHLFWAALGYVLFIIYGSLLPFEPNGLPLTEAWTRFQDISLLKLGVGSRADLVANLLLYIPAGFLLMGALAGESRSIFVKATGVAVSGLLLIGLAVAIEFTQEFFPPRTVSLNDLYAESAGSALGIVIWVLAGTRLLRTGRRLAQGGQPAQQAALALYALAYLFLSLFPYDFLMSSAEWHAHLASSKVGWLFAGSCGPVCLAKLVPEILAAAPFGLLLRGNGKLKRTRLVVIGMIGILLGLGLEILQLTIQSGVSQGASVVTRALGVVLGALLPDLFRRVDMPRLLPSIKLLAGLALIPYFGLLAWLNHWFAEPWSSSQAALSRLSGVRFIPFYYHYYTSEAVALVSALAQSGMYGALGAAVWLWWLGGKSSLRGGPMALLLGLVAGLVIEAGKLFAPDLHPDPTNVLLAGISSGLAYVFLAWLFPVGPAIGRPAKRSVVPESRNAAETLPAAKTKATLVDRLLALGLLIAAMSSLWGYPLGWGFPAMLLVLAAFLWRRPGSWLIVLPAALPLMDFTCLSGRLYWSEFDTLLLLSLAIAYAHGYTSQAIRFAGRVPLLLFLLSVMTSLAIGLLPFEPIDLNAFTHYTSSYNALRAVKGVLFAIAFWPLIKAEWLKDAALAADRLALGMTLGLASELVYVVWERLTYSGLWNFDTDYRITGSFPGMHIGGASIEAYLVLAAPFLWLWTWQRRQPWVVLTASALYLLSAYGVMVTFSRGGQAAFAVATLLAFAGFMRLLWKHRGRMILGSAVLVLTVVVAGLVAWPIVSGKFSQSRLTNIKTDTGIRLTHWRDALDILSQAGNPVVGAGSGTFPAAFYWFSSAPTRPGSYAFVAEGDNVFLRLGGGESLYFEQIVPVKPDREYRILMDLRSKTKSAALTVPLCEKALLYSFTCAWNTVRYGSDTAAWVHKEIPVKASRFGPPGSLFQRPVKLSMFNQGAGTMIDIDNVALLDESGRNLIVNGDFARGMERWDFSTDSHLAWHAKNLFVHVFFEQGWFGLASFVTLLAVVMLGLFKRAADDALALTLLVSLTAFLIVGLVDTIIDEPRLDFLFFWLLIIAMISGAKPLEKTQRARRKPHAESAV